MTVKLFKALWFISLLAVLVVLLLVYASLPEQVVIKEENARLITLPRDGVFFIAVALLAVLNVLVFVISKVYSHNKPFRTWFYGLIVTVNAFIMISLNLINTFNSGERFNYSSISFIIYGSLGLIVLWAISWPFYSLFQKISHKQTI